MSKVNPKEAPSGYYAVEDTVGGTSCRGCVFISGMQCTRSERMREHGGYCTSEERRDGHNVIFKKGKALMAAKKAKASRTELFWAKRIVTEEQWFLIEVTKGADKGKILEACLEGDAMYGTPHDSVTKQSDVDIKDFEELNNGQFGTPIDLIKETAP